MLKGNKGGKVYHERSSNGAGGHEDQSRRQTSTCLGHLHFLMFEVIVVLTRATIGAASVHESMRIEMLMAYDNGR